MLNKDGRLIGYGCIVDSGAAEAWSAVAVSKYEISIVYGRTPLEGRCCQSGAGVVSLHSQLKTQMLK